MKSRIKYKIIAFVLCLTLLITNLMPISTSLVYGSNTTKDSIGSVNEEDDGVTVGLDKTQDKKTLYSNEIIKDSNEDTLVYVSQASTFSVIIPKIIILNGDKTQDGINKGEYVVKVIGNIGGEESVDLIPEDTFLMHQYGKNSITANVDQDKTSWKHNEFDIVGNGVVSTNDMTAGSWNGSFIFNISLKTNITNDDTNNDQVQTLSAGLYDENDVLVASWDELINNNALTVTNGVLNTGDNYSILTNKLVIDESVTSIAVCAFDGGRGANLTTIIMPDTITTIQSDAFYDCDNLEMVKLSNNLTTIQSNAFYGCTKLTTIDIPDSVTTIDEFAFDGTGLETIEFPNKITNISWGVVAYSKNLKTITIPNSVTTIDDGAFQNCTSLETIYFEGTIEEWNNINIVTDNNERLNYTTIVCKDGTITPTITAGLYNENNELIVSWIDLVETYGMIVSNNYTYSTYKTNSHSPYNVLKNNNLSGNLVIDNTVSYIGNYSFADCDTLNSIVIPNSVSSIGSNAFRGCLNLNEITLPNTIDNISNNAFDIADTEEVNNLKTIYYNGTMQQWNSLVNTISVDYGNEILYYAKIVCSDGVIEEDTVTGVYDSNNVMIYGIRELVTMDSLSIDSYGLYAGPTSNVLNPTLVIGSRINKIKDSGFYDCSGLKNVIIKDGVTYLGESAFASSSIESVTIPQSITTVEEGVFCNCTNLTTVNLPETLTTISWEAFTSCDNLTTITIPNSVTTIDENALSVTNLETFTFPNQITNIEYEVLGSCKNLKVVTIPNSVTTIEDSAFVNCTNLQTVYFNGTKTEWNAITIDEENNEYLLNANIIFLVSELEAGLYDSSNNLKVSWDTMIANGDIEVSNNVVNYLNSQLTHKYNITNATLIIPIGITSLQCNFTGDGDYEVSVQKVILPNTLTTIGGNAFYECYALNTIVIPVSVKTIERSAFENCDCLTNVYYMGTQNDWNNISIGLDNDCLTDATITYNYVLN